MSLVAKLKDRISRDYIYQTRLPDGTKLPNLKELALKYNTTPVTVSKAVEVLTFNKMLTKRRGSGIFISHEYKKAKELTKNKQTQTIQYLMQHSENNIDCRSFTDEILQGIGSVTQQQGYDLNISYYHNFPAIKKFCGIIETSLESGADGIIFYPPPVKSSDILGCKDMFHDYPIVVVDQYEDQMDCSHVIFDNEQAGYSITKHLIDCGKKRIAFPCFRKEILYRSVEDRLKGYRKAMTEHFGDNNSDLVIPLEPVYTKDGLGYDYNNLRKIIDYMLKSKDVDAIVFPSDVFTQFALEHLTAEGIEVPGQIMIAGFDYSFRLFGSPQWPTTYSDFYWMGKKAAEIMFKLLSDEMKTVREILLPCPLQLPEINRAAKYIDEKKSLHCAALVVH